MIHSRNTWLWLGVFTLLYPVAAVLVHMIPNPVVPGSYLALNMIIPVLAGYFFGPFSGLLAGGGGTLIEGLVWPNDYSFLSVVPHAFMGLCAGYAGNRKWDLSGAFCILTGHILNMLIYTNQGLVSITYDTASTILLGLSAEATVGIIASLLGISVLKTFLYRTDRW